MCKRVFIPALILLSLSNLQAQKKKLSLKDSLDGKIDLSSYIIDAHGFVPVPSIITEPALGNFGGLIAPLFINKHKPYIDTIKGKAVFTPVSPDITGGAAMYTANNSWALGVGRMGTITKWGLKYKAISGYANLNLDFYKQFPIVGETCR